MSSKSIDQATALSRLAAALTETPSDFASLASRLSQSSPTEHLPPISEELEALMWSSIEGDLDADQERAFQELAEANPQVLLHLQQIVRVQQKQLDRSSARKPTTRLKPDYVIVIGRSGLRHGAGTVRRDSRSFAMVRSGAEDSVTSLSEDRLTTVGTASLTIDYRSDGTCRLSLVFTNPLRDVDSLLVQRRNAADDVMAQERPRSGAVRFSGVSSGQHQIVINDPEAQDAELDRFVIELQPEDASDSIEPS